MTSSASGSAGNFATTRWSVVLAAGDHTGPQAQAALATLCQGYWYPLYVFARRQGHGPEDAQDLTQGFFARLLEKDFLRSVDPGKGRFRSFLLAAYKHFLANERDRANAQKRGGGRLAVPIDLQGAEDRYRLEPAHTLTAERLFERRWAMTLLGQVLGRLREEFVAVDNAPHFEVLKAFLTGERSDIRYAEVGRQLGMSEGAVKVAVHRLRGRYRELLREEIARTVDDPAQVDEEIRGLFLALGP